MIVECLNPVWPQGGTAVWITLPPRVDRAPVRVISEAVLPPDPRDAAVLIRSIRERIMRDNERVVSVMVRSPGDNPPGPSAAIRDWASEYAAAGLPVGRVPDSRPEVRWQRLLRTIERRLPPRAGGGPAILIDAGCLLTQSELQTATREALASGGLPHVDVLASALMMMNEPIVDMEPDLDVLTRGAAWYLGTPARPPLRRGSQPNPPPRVVFCGDPGWIVEGKILEGGEG